MKKVSPPLSVGLLLLAFWAVKLPAQADFQYHRQTFRFQASGGHGPDPMLVNAIIGDGHLLTQRSDQRSIYQSPPVNLPLKQEDPYLSLSFQLSITPFLPQYVSVQVEWNDGQGNWSQPQVLTYCAARSDSKTWQSQPIERHTGQNQFRYTVSIAARASIGDPALILGPVQLHHTSITGLSSPQPQDLHQQVPGSVDPSALAPTYWKRSAWAAPDPDTQQYTCPSPRYAPVTHVVVTHSISQSPGNHWPALVLALWSYHVNVLGRCDIGFNWLIDPAGNIYEGRGGGYGVVGDYLCGDSEVGTSSICLLGDWQNAAPTPEQQESLAQLTAWQMGQSHTCPGQTATLIGAKRALPVITQPSRICSPGCGLLDLSQWDLVSQVAHQMGDCFTSISEKNGLDDNQVLAIFPNPNAGEFQLRMVAQRPAPAHLRLLDNQGRVIWSRPWSLQTGENMLFVTASALSAGLYHLSLTSPAGVATRILRVEK